MEKLYALGFLPSATIQQGQNGWNIEIVNNRGASNVLYAFIFHSGQGDALVSRAAYIGHTRKTFENRMRGYQHGNGRAVNYRVHSAIDQHLGLGGSVEVLCLPNTNRMTIHDIPVDIAAGLEYGLITFFARFNETNGHPPLLNIAGNPVRMPDRQDIVVDEEALAQGEQAEEEMEYNEIEPRRPPQAVANPLIRRDDRCFDLRLTEQTYWPAGSINVPIRLAHLFGVHGSVVGVRLIANDIDHHVEAVINRNANLNGAPRLLFQGEHGKRYRDWKKRNHQPNSIVKICVIEDDFITVE